MLHSDNIFQQCRKIKGNIQQKILFRFYGFLIFLVKIANLSIVSHLLELHHTLIYPFFHSFPQPALAGIPYPAPKTLKPIVSFLAMILSFCHISGWHHSLLRAESSTFFNLAPERHRTDYNCTPQLVLVVATRAGERQGNPFR